MYNDKDYLFLKSKGKDKEYEFPSNKKSHKRDPSPLSEPEEATKKARVEIPQIPLADQ